MNPLRRMTVRSWLFLLLLGALIMAIVLRQHEIKVVLKHVIKPNEKVAQEDISAMPVVVMLENKNGTQVSDDQSKRWVILFWTTVFGTRLTSKHEVAWKKGDCPVACELTVNTSRWREADAFVVHGTDAHMIPPTHSVPWILYTQENPLYAPVLGNPEKMSEFSLLRSYRLDSDFPNPVFDPPDLATPVPFNEKTGLIFVALSNCEPVRTEYVRQLMKFAQVDSYGGCARNKDGLVNRYGNDFKSLKTEFEKKYKFTLVFFNGDCDYFVDDQLIHALSAGSVPVVMATDKLDEFLPGNLRNSVIRVRDFKNPQHLAEYLKYLGSNETEYNRFLEWKWKGFGDIAGSVIERLWNRDYPIDCEICVALSEGRVHKDGLKAVPCKPRAYEDWGITKGA